MYLYSRTVCIHEVEKKIFLTQLMLRFGCCFAAWGLRHRLCEAGCDGMIMRRGVRGCRGGGLKPLRGAFNV